MLVEDLYNKSAHTHGVTCNFCGNENVHLLIELDTGRKPGRKPGIPDLQALNRILRSRGPVDLCYLGFTDSGECASQKIPSRIPRDRLVPPTIPESRQETSEHLDMGKKTYVYDEVSHSEELIRDADSLKQAFATRQLSGKVLYTCILQRYRILISYQLKEGRALKRQLRYAEFLIRKGHIRKANKIMGSLPIFKVDRYNMEYPYDRPSFRMPFGYVKGFRSIAFNKKSFSFLEYLLATGSKMPGSSIWTTRRFRPSPKRRWLSNL